MEYPPKKCYLTGHPHFYYPYTHGLPLSMEYGLPEADSCLLCKTLNIRKKVVEPKDYEKRFASIRIFSTMLLKAWRQRRLEVKQLKTKIDDFKKGTMKTKNQIHVYNTLFRVEQRRNDELTCQLKHSMVGVNKARTSCESLTTSVISLKADKAILEKELRRKFQDLEALSDVLGQTKNDLMRSVKDQTQLQTRLKKERMKMQTLETEKNKLIKEVVVLNEENNRIKLEYLTKMEKKDIEIQRANSLIGALQEDINNLRCKTTELEAKADNNTCLKLEVEELQEQVKMLEKSINESLDQKVRVYLKKYQHFRRIALQLAHFIAYILFPAIPEPKFTFAFNRSFLKMSI